MQSHCALPFVRALLLLVAAGVPGACSFDEGPDWPADPAVTRRQAAQSTSDTARDQGRASLADFAGGTPAPPHPGSGALLVGKEPPLAVVRFGAAPVDFQSALYDAVRAALERRPTAVFDLVAVTPYVGGAEEQAFADRLERVFRALLDMGLPAERLSLSALSLPGVRTDEVRVYVR